MSDEISESDKVQGARPKQKEIVNEEDVILENCDHIIKFLEEISKKKKNEFSKESQGYISKTTDIMMRYLGVEESLGSTGGKLRTENIQDFSCGSDRKSKQGMFKDKNSSLLIKTEQSGSGSSTGSDSNDGKKKKKRKVKRKVTNRRSKGLLKSTDSSADSNDNLNNQSILEVIAKKLDNRRTPTQGKFDNDNGEELENYLIKFERYCKANIKGSRDFWVDELEERFTGEMLEGFKTIREVNDSYEDVKDKLINWYDGTKDVRRNRAKEEFNNAKCSIGEALFLYSKRLEKLFRRAFPKKKVEISKTLREKFMTKRMMKSPNGAQCKN